MNKTVVGNSCNIATSLSRLADVTAQIPIRDLDVLANISPGPISGSLHVSGVNERWTRQGCPAARQAHGMGLAGPGAPQQKASRGPRCYPAAREGLSRVGVQESCAPRQARQADLQARRLARRSGSASSSSEDSSPELKSGSLPLSPSPSFAAFPCACTLASASCHDPPAVASMPSVCSGHIAPVWLI